MSALNVRPISLAWITGKHASRDVAGYPVASIEALAEDMREHGQRHPILLTPGERLLKGGRRVRAAHRLGWTTLNAVVVHTVEEAAEQVVAQQTGFTDREDPAGQRRRTVEEAVDLALAIEALPLREPRRRNASHSGTINLVGPAAFSSGGQYKRARALVMASRSTLRPPDVVAAARKAIQDIDEGSATVSGAYERWRAVETGRELPWMRREDAPVPAVDDGLPVDLPPMPKARTPQARRRRIEWIVALAAKGASSDQIADKLGVSASGVRKICRDEGIAVPADKVVAKTQRKRPDPHRAMTVILSDLDALAWSLDQVEASGVEPSMTADWAARLHDYALSIDRVSRKLKEMP